MGAVISSFQDVVATLGFVVRLIASLNTKYNNVFERVNSMPPLPVANSTAPYWLNNAPYPELNNVNDTSSVPPEADVVIIGSGITAVAAARTILELSRTPSSVLVLEARDICSGATGRNGGHIKTSPYHSFIELRKTLSSDEEARDVVRFLMRHLPLLKEFAAKYPAAQIRDVETVDLFLSDKDFDAAKKDVQMTLKWLPEIEIEIWTAEQARDRFAANETVAGAITYKAGAMWPFRFVTSLWKDLVVQFSDRLTLMARTPVVAVKTSTDGMASHPYMVETSRGTIKARHVLHATNGYAGHLLPELRPCLTGLRGHMSAQKPGDAFPATDGNRSWSIVHLPGLDYVTQLPNNADGSQGDVMMGGGFARGADEGLDNIAVWDDSSKDTLTMVHINGILPSIFEPNWGTGGGLKKAWSGIMGFTGDMRPFVGPIPDARSKKHKSSKLQVDAGQWIAAGFNGNGMIWSWLSGAAVGIMIAGRDEDMLEKDIGRPDGKLDDWFPRKATAWNDKRLKTANLKALAGEVM
ncbi:hypothetical protein LMH87_009486 [Akanthomyces muscarius]|uniref:FAD dependent oxidoreductase domain-containing protein n=1 Tax=Akanthomyces muscarius TaxID=2231603 RepID=A0A9W8QC02_AKAMU|nr:hypothetical protein LMH87_009486 [Akanthomyces muscarius]KAJ4152971.1 hypothetical protein LMH87_009486 [Akanthomyces muscarius]